MRRSVAKLLAFVMLAGFCVQGWPAAEVYAAGLPPKLAISVTQTLQRSISQARVPVGPVTQTSDYLGAQQALLSWETDNNAYEYVLSYFKDDNKRVEVIVRRGDADFSNCTVYYRVQNTATGQWMNETGNAGYGVYPDVGNILTGSGFFDSAINAPVIDSGTQRPVSGEYVDINDQFGNVYDTKNANGVYTFTASGTTYELPPIIKLAKGGGISFMYDGVTVHLKYLANGTFYLATDQILYGNIYEFDLQYRGSSGGALAAADPKGNRYAFTGFDRNKMESEPRANSGDLGVKDTLEYPHKTPLDPTNFPQIETCYVDAGLRVTVPMPKIYDTTAGEFLSVHDAAGALPAGITLPEMQVLLQDTKTNKAEPAIQIKFPDLASLAAGFLTIDTDFTVNSGYWTGLPSGPPTVELIQDASGEYCLEISINNLKPGIIYADSSTFFNTVKDSPIITKETRFPRGSVYTFMKYIVRDIDGVYYFEVEPYVGYPGTYELYDAGLYTEGPVLEEKSDGSGKVVLLPLLPGSGTDRTYYVEFKPSTEPGQAAGFEARFESQRMLVYMVPADVVTRPRFFQVLSHEMTPVVDVSTGVDYTHGRLTTDLYWDIGDAAAIQDFLDKMEAAGEPPVLVIVYTLYGAPTPREDPSYTPPAQDLEAYAHIKVTITKETDAGGNIVYYAEYDDFDDPSDPTPLGAHVVKPNKTRLGAGRTLTDHYEARVSLVFDTVQEPAVPTPPVFGYPKIYFLNIVPEWATKRDDSVPGAVTYDFLPTQKITGSNFDSITLSDLRVMQPPPPQNLKLDFDGVPSPSDEIGFHASWNISDDKLNEFLRLSYGLTETPKMSVVMYVSQDQTRLEKLSGLQYVSERQKPPGPGGDNQRLNDPSVVTYRFEPGATRSNVMLFSDVPSDPDYETLKRVEIDEQYNWQYTTDPIFDNPRDALRGLRFDGGQEEGRIVAVMIDDIGAARNFSYYLENLDKNQKYYVYVDLFVWQNLLGTDPVTGSPVSFWLGDLSLVSEMAAITTKGEKQVPDGTDKVPPAPLGLDKKDVGSDRATVFWNRVKLLTDNPLDTSYVEYEIIRMRENPMDAQTLNRRDEFNLIFDPLPEEKMGFRSDGGLLYLYSGGDFTEAADPEKYEYNDLDPDQIFFTDRTLTPNTLYYYYVRTVKIDSLGRELYSTWSHLTLTTDPVQPPINLRIETGRTDYTPETEVFISFDAPISYAALDQTLGVLFDLQYQIKKEGEEWGEHVTMDAATLRADAAKSTVDKDPKTGDPMEYTHFVYKISGLTPGTGYSVRVRMVDIVTGDGSLYSNIATFRTDMNQEKYDNEKEADDWMYFLKQEYEKLAKNPYWTVQDDAARFEIIYRPGMFESVLAVTKDSRFILPESTAGQAVYNIPVSCYESATKAETGFVASHANLSVFLSPGAVDLANNPVALLLKDAMKKDTFADYFVRITINWNKAPVEIEGSKTMSDIADVWVELVPVSGKISNWDDTVQLHVREKLKELSALDRTREYFLAQLGGKATNEELSKYVMRTVDNAKKDLHRIVRDDLKDTLKQIFRILEFDKPVIVAAAGIDPAASVSALHRLEAAWTPLEVTQFGEAKAVFTNRPGAYVFTGRLVNIPGIEKTEKGGTVTGIVAKYGLDDFFGTDVIVMEANATRMMVIGSVARMSGAPKGADPFEWLKTNKGLTLSTRDPGADITTQEALFAMMSLYETKTGTKVATLKIRNYNATAGIKGLDDKYKQSVRAAFETGFYTNTNMQPKGPVTIGEVLRMLGVLDGKTKL